MTENLRLKFGHNGETYGAVNVADGNITELTTVNTQTTTNDFSFAQHDTQTIYGVVWSNEEDAVPHSFYDETLDLTEKGVLYNAYVASAGYVQLSNLSTTHFFASSICPKHWTLIDYRYTQSLMSLYGLVYENYVSVDATDIAESPTSFTWSGYYNWGTGTWNSKSYSVELWTNRYQSNGNVTRMYFRNDSADDTLANPYSGGAPWHGRAVRCRVNV